MDDGQNTVILCTGFGSTIVQALGALRPLEPIRRLEKRSEEIYDFEPDGPTTGLRIVLAGGYLAGLADGDHTEQTRVQTLEANYLTPMNIADQALSEIPDVRICIIGSQSAIAGSYDTQYAQAKVMLHRWVLRQKGQIASTQQLVVVAPPIIADSGMTRRRHDYPQVLQERPHCMAEDVASMIVQVLYEEPIKVGENSCCVRYVPATHNRGLDTMKAKSPRPC